MGGWLPASVVSLVTTQAFPISMRRANSQLKKIQNHKTVSDLIERSEGRGNGQVVVKEQNKVEQASFVTQFLKALQKSQPWMILAILLIVLFRRK